MNPSSKGIDNLPQITKKEVGCFIRIDQYIENKEYEPWLNDFVNSLYEKKPIERPTAKEALVLLQKFQNEPKVKQIFYDLKSKKSNLENINVLFKRDNYGKDNINSNLNSATNKALLKTKQMNNSKIGERIMFNDSSIISEGLENNASNFYLNPYITQNDKINKIRTSMKSLLQILFQLNLFTIPPNTYNNLFINSFYDILIIIKQFQNGEINKVIYDQKIHEFTYKVFNYNNSGISGIRPVILFYMITSIFKDEFNLNFKNCENNISDNFIKTNFSELNNIVPIMYNINVYNEISIAINNFKNNYKGPFVDNFYFLILNVSKCPNCNNILNTRTQAAQFLKLDVVKEQNFIWELINNYFFPKTVFENYKCLYCGFKGEKSETTYCLNSPNYLILELEEKNSVNFNDNIILPLFNGHMNSYQYISGIYELKNNDTSEFIAVIKRENNYYTFYSDNKLEQCPKEFINLQNPSIVIYQKVPEIMNNDNNNIQVQSNYKQYYNINTFDNNLNNNNELDKKNFIFKDNNISTILKVSNNTIILDLIKLYLKRKSIPISDINNYFFIYNADNISKYLEKPVSDIFKHQINYRVIVTERSNLIGA